MPLSLHSVRARNISVRVLSAGLFLFMAGCMNRTPDMGLGPVTPLIVVHAPVTGDTVNPGPIQIQYDMDNSVNAVRFELYVNDTLVSSVAATQGQKKPSIVWNVDTLFLDRRVRFYVAAYDLDSVRATSVVMQNILVSQSPTPPNAPENLVLTRFGQSSVNLSWDDMSTNETAMEVWKRISDGPYTMIQSLPAHSISANDTGIVDGISYHYRIRAVNAHGYADSKEAGLGLDIVVMNPPTNLLATPMGTKMVMLQWQDNSSGELAFVIERRITSGSVYTQVGLAGPNETSFMDTSGLVGSSSYTYRVAARGQFEQSSWSNEETVVTLYLDTYPPSNLVAVADSSGKSVELMWRSNTIYDSQTRIERRDDPGGSFSEIGKVGTTVTTYHDTTTQARFAYSYRVRVLSVDGHFTFYSNIASIVLGPVGAAEATERTARRGSQ